MKRSVKEKVRQLILVRKQMSETEKMRKVLVPNSLDRKIAFEKERETFLISSNKPKLGIGPEMYQMIFECEFE